MTFGRAMGAPPRMQRIEDRPIANADLRELVRAVLDKGVPFRFHAPGFSMWPFIRDGDVVTIAPFALRGRVPRLGEVVAFVRPDSGRLTIHRVIAARGGGWLVRGDNCSEPDGVVAREDILGVVAQVERDGRSVGLGLGAERRLIAWLNGREWLLPLKQFVLLPRRPASALLRRLQQLPRYRAWVKRFRPVYSIDEATPRDLIAVQAWMNPGSDAILAGPMPGVTNYVVKRDNHLLGFVQLVRHPQEHFPYVGAWLFSLVVRGRYRGMGIGEALTRRVIEQAQSERAPELRLLVFADNMRAINVYRKLGFEVVDAPEFAQPLDDEARQTGRRRVVMHCSLEKDQSKNV